MLTVVFDRSNGVILMKWNDP